MEKWHVVFGGSWGSTLALSYAIRHPDRTGSLILRGVFLFDEPSMRFLFEQGGASEMYPDKWEKYAGFIPAGERLSLLHAYYKRVSSEDESVCVPAAREFVRWELTISKLQLNEEALEHALEDTSFIVPFARAETHFFVHGGFFPGEEEGEEGGSLLRSVGPGSNATGHPWIVRHLDAIADIPTAIVHGRQDIVCRPRAAWEVARRLNNCTLEFVYDSGHSEGEPGTIDGLVRAADRMAELP